MSNPQERIIQVPDPLPALTKDQAAAIMGTTGVPTMPMQQFLEITLDRIKSGPAPDPAASVQEQLRKLFQPEFDFICLYKDD